MEFWQAGTDATDCHVDALARVARPGVVLLNKANDAEAKDRTIVHEQGLEIFSNATDTKGRPFEIIEIEEPDPELFPPGGLGNSPPVRSYVNYVLANEGIILPQFGDPAYDAAAIRVVQRLLGDRENLPRSDGRIATVRRRTSCSDAGNAYGLAKQIIEPMTRSCWRTLAKVRAPDYQSISLRLAHN